MKNTPKIHRQNYEQNSALDPSAPMVLNALYSTPKKPELFYIPGYRKFAYTPFISEITKEYRLFALLEIIFNFKLAILNHKTPANSITDFEIVVYRTIHGTFQAGFSNRSITVHIIDLGQRDFNFDILRLNLIDNYCGAKHLLCLSEELADIENFINH